MYIPFLSRYGVIVFGLVVLPCAVAAAPLGATSADAPDPPGTFRFTGADANAALDEVPHLPSTARALDNTEEGETLGLTASGRHRSHRRPLGRCPHRLVGVYQRHRVVDRQLAEHARGTTNRRGDPLDCQRPTTLHRAHGP